MSSSSACNLGVEEQLMKETRKNTIKTLSALLPVGVMGMSVALASTTPAETPATPASGGETQVASRLASIRDAVSAVSAEEQARDGNVQTAWWANWHGGGIRFGGWRNGGWHNGGWGNGGGGWANGWPNGWHNWGNGWHNGWHNWHNW
jgi:rSAM-associated Gly-rich repeat protein